MYRSYTSSFEAFAESGLPNRFRREILGIVYVLGDLRHIAEKRLGYFIFLLGTFRLSSL